MRKKLKTKKARTLFNLFLCGSAGLLVGFSPSLASAQEDEGGRRGRAEARGSDGEAGGRRGGARGQRGPQGEGRRGEGRPGQGRPGGGPGGPGGGGPEMLMRLPVIAALDADGDGVISEKEIANATAALKKLDKNNDGKLTFQEIRPSFGEGGPGGRGGAGGRGFAGRGRPGGEGGDRPESQGRRPGGPGGAERGGPGGPGGPGGRDPRAMMERFRSLDKDGDGLLSKDEMPEMMKGMLERADSDGDGKLSTDEIRKAMEARMRGGSDRPGAGRPGGGGRPGAGRDSDVPGGQKPRRPPAE